MGLLESLLNVPQQLRVWQMSGVRYFYLDEPATPAAPETVPVPETAPTDPATWPAPWPSFWSKVPDNPDLVLTYLDLGRDLLGQGDKRRSLLWRNLIHDLGWSGQNRIAFWPMAVPEGDLPCPQPDIFRQGLRLLAPKAVAFFGASAATPFAPDQTSHTLTAQLGFPCVILPEPGLLLQGDKEDWDAVLAALGTL